MTDEEIYNHINEACKTPVSSAAGDDEDSNVSEMEPLPPADPHCHNEAANNMNDDINDELYIPCNTADHRTLVHQFRNEILHDWIAEDRGQLGLFESFDAHQHDMAELGTALQNDNKLGNKIYISTAHILRHDWDRRADCQYTIEISGRKHRGSGELLNHQFAGVRRAIWQYWKKRDRASIPTMLTRMWRPTALTATSESLCGTTCLLKDGFNSGDNVESRDELKFEGEVLL
jgi:hypothetical protein